MVQGYLQTFEDRTLLDFLYGYWNVKAVAVTDYMAEYQVNSPNKCCQVTDMPINLTHNIELNYTTLFLLIIFSCTHMI